MNGSPRQIAFAAAMCASPLAIAQSGANDVTLPGIGRIVFSGGEVASPVVPPIDRGETIGLGGCTAPLQSFNVDDHGLVVRPSGQVVAWGRNNFGQTVVPGALGATRSVHVGQWHSYTVSTGGSLTGWGINIYNEINTPPGLPPVELLAVSQDNNFAVLADGSVVAWGCENCPFDFGSNVLGSEVRDVVALDAESIAGVAIRDDGRVVAWGGSTPPNWGFPSVTCGQRNVPADLGDLGDVVAVASGTLHALALRADGTVVAWGAECRESDFGQADVPAGLTDVVAISAGSQHSLALRADGTVVGWGLDTDGQATPPPGLQNVVAIDAEQTQSAALLEDGTLVVWGWSEGGGNVPSGLVVREPGCNDASPCPADLTGEGDLNTNDFFAFLALYQSGAPGADFASGDGINVNDFFAYLTAYQAGC